MGRISKKDYENTYLEFKKSIPNYFDNNMVKTNIRVLDKALSGGLEIGNMVQIVAESGMGKTTILLNMSMKLCSGGNTVLYIDAEGSVSKQLLETTGLLPFLNKEFLYIRESTFKNVEDVLDKFIDAGEVKYIFIDSIACIVPDKFFDTNEKKKVSITTNHSLNLSRPLTLFMQKYNSVAKSKNITFIISNQYRNKIDMTQGTVLREYGSKTVRYNSDIILRISPIKTTGENVDSLADELKKITKSLVDGICLELEIIKSNKSNAGKRYPFFLLYGKGPSNVVDFIYEYIKKGKLIRDGSIYSFEVNNQKVKIIGISDVYNYFIKNYETIENELKN